MERKKTKILKESVILLAVMLLLGFFLLSWVDNYRTISDRILREHIIRGAGLEIKDKVDLASRVLDTLSKNENITLCINNNQNIITQSQSNMLEGFRTLAGASLIYIMDKNGLVKCSTTYDKNKTLIGNNYSFRYYFRAARRGKMILYPAVGVTTGRRGIYLSKPIRVNGEITGVAVIKTDMTGFDKILKASGKKLLLVSPDGIIFASSSKDLLLKAIKPLSPAIRRKIEINRQYPDLSPEVLNIKDNFPFDFDGNAYRTLTRAILLPDWRLVLLTPDSTDYPPLSDSYQKLFITIGALLLVIYILVQAGIFLNSRN